MERMQRDADKEERMRTNKRSKREKRFLMSCVLSMERKKYHFQRRACKKKEKAQARERKRK